jgi:peroxiredoxin Q/BCP
MAKAIAEGAKAPAFTLALDDGEFVTLKDLAGEKVVLYFYPKDDTAGCTQEAVDFSAAAAKVKRAGARVIGVSRDSLAKHKKFREKHSLNIALGADEDGKVTDTYGVWVEKSMYGRKFMGIERATFLIDEKGIVRKIWRKVKVAGHVDEVLAAVKAL